MCLNNKVTVNGSKVKKANFHIKRGDKVDICYSSFNRDIIVLELATSRGSPATTSHLYNEVTLPQGRTSRNLSGVSNRRYAPGRPSKRELRSLARFFGNPKFS
jgi:ribosomal 50S subunit-recycling heat shock protein